MPTKVRYLLSLFCICVLLSIQHNVLCQSTSETFPHYKDISLDKSKWQVSAGKDAPSLRHLDSYTYYATSDLSKIKTPKKGYGGALNLKYFTGLDYNYLKEQMPGKTISVDVFIPEESLAKDKSVPNRLRICMKSETNGVWAEYHEGEKWKYITESGTHTFSMTLPKEPVVDQNGRTFDPSNSILFSIEFFVMEGVEAQPHTSFFFSNFRIEGIELDHNSVKWQYLKDGYADTNIFIPAFVGGSTFINPSGAVSAIRCGDFDLAAAKNYFDGTLNRAFVSLSLFIPEELRRREGSVSASIKAGDLSYDSGARALDACDLEGKVRLTLLLDGFDAHAGKGPATVSINLNTHTPHTSEMMPIVLEPAAVKKASLVPFDNKWTVRDIQGMGGYGKLNVRSDGALTDSGVTVAELGDKVYQLIANMRLKGGIDWKGQFYRVEFLRSFEDGPMDLENTRIELSVSPITGTLDVWQKPFRARVGLLDVNDKAMFGPNVSLSEGLLSVAYLDVTGKCPIPKGFVMPGFDLKKVKALLINIEASHAFMPPREIKASFENLTITYCGDSPSGAINKIDFSTFRKDPESWQITKMIRDTGGYLVGVNYPFPVVDVSKEIMEVPQVYPTVGMKPSDQIHLGYSSEITRKATLRDFKQFAQDGVNVIRLFMFGHLEGVFKFDERGKDIIYFAEGRGDLVKEMSEMRIEDLAKFLNESDEALFDTTADGYLLGVETHVMPDFIALLDALEETERATGKRMVVIMSLYDFLLGDGIKTEGPMRKFTVGEHSEVVTDPVTKVKAHALTWKMMKLLTLDERFYRYVGGVEIMNEPDNATALSTKEHFHDLVNFVGEGLYLLKDALGPTVPVSVGFRSWHDDLKYWSNVGEGIDMLIPHYWQSLESYNIDTPGLWPLDMSTDELWKRLGTEKNGRLTGMAEMSPQGAFKTNLLRLEKAGYDFSLPWSFSGHDGHNIKPVMPAISRYQEGNYKFAELKKMPADNLRQALSYLINSRISFETMNNFGPDDSPADIDKKFLKHILDGSDGMRDDPSKQALAEILSVSGLKDMTLNLNNLRYLWGRLLGKEKGVFGEKFAEAAQLAAERTPASEEPIYTVSMVMVPAAAPMPLAQKIGHRVVADARAESPSSFIWGWKFQAVLLLIIMLLSSMVLRYRRERAGWARKSAPLFSSGLATDTVGDSGARPDFYIGRERRRFTRYSYVKPVHYSVFDADTDPENARIPADALSENISISGTLFVTRYSPPGLSTILSLDFDFREPTLGKYIETRNVLFRDRILARVVRTIKNKNGTYSVGVSFLQKSGLEKDEPRLTEILSEKAG